jgi:hypothetical protein
MTEIEVLFGMYKFLREEIRQSIDAQNKIILGGGILIGLFYGLQLNGINSSSYYSFLIFAIAPISIISIILWTIEQSRIMRAGMYLEFLEDKINNNIGEVILTWENWLRRGEMGKLDPHTIHHFAQYLVFILFFPIIGFFSIFIIYTDYKAILSSKLFLYTLFNSIGLLIVIIMAILVINHKKVAKEEYREWEDKYLDNHLIKTKDIENEDTEN